MEILSLPPTADTALATLAPPLRSWFDQRLGEPTAAQRLAWPVVAAGRHLLLVAPTGTGKTLAAFLPILDHLLAHPVAPGVRCLYVAPLKALTNDVRKTLRQHLRGLQAFLPADTFLPRVGLRTGDTSPQSRREQRLDPPDVLLTTPESLALMLAQPAAEDWFRGLRWVIVDEVHALAGNKRGADLSVSLERLTALAGERLQRLGLSATCAPLDRVARFLVGKGRDVVVAVSGGEVSLELSVEPLPETGRFLTDVMERIAPELERNRSTLIFANTRGLAERLSWALRRRFPEWDDAIAVHHSALAPERRRRVEHRFKRGRLRAVVSSTSLELGIDVGPVDGVVLVHPPGGVVRLLQRVGRAGHEPGGTRRGLVLTASPADLLEAAATAAASRSGQCEPLTIPAHPLDVLCQQLLGLAMRETPTADEAFALVRRAYPFRDLSRDDFDGCLAYLLGRRFITDAAEWLPARLRREGDHLVILDRRTERIVRRNLGTILAEEPRRVYLDDDDPFAEASRRHVGEVAEAFAERLQPGDRFLLDGRCLEFRRHEGPTVMVQEVLGRPLVPRWGGDGVPLSPQLARRLYLMRQRAGEALLQGPEGLAELLTDEYELAGPAVASLSALFQRQESFSEVPGAGLLIEVVQGGEGVDYYLHTPLNQAGNDALLRVLMKRLARDRGCSGSSLVADLGLAIRLRGDRELTADDWRGLLTADRFDADLDEALAGSPVLRERFRRVATTGLMLLRQPLGRKRRVGGADWGDRRLYDQVEAADAGFVLLRQAHREVRSEVCDAEHARAFLAELPRRLMKLRYLGQPSPFVENWSEINPGPAATTEDPAEALRRLHAALTGRAADAGPS